MVVSYLLRILTTTVVLVLTLPSGRTWRTIWSRYSLD
jgi:hypothetical protein